MSRKKYSLRDIAKAIKRSVSTLSYELCKNSVNGKYDSKKAGHKSYVARKYSKFQGMKIAGDKPLREFVEMRLYDRLSPEAISGRLKNQEKNRAYVSKESIYRYIKSVYGRKIESFRNRRQKRRGKRNKNSIRLNDRAFINKRPGYIEKRQRVGDAEADFVVSGKTGKGILLVVVDRKTRAAFLERIIKITIVNVHRAFSKIKERFSEMKTLTVDNDILLRKHKELEILLKVKIYFCDPYHSWQKGTVENANRYIRRDIPKGSNISSYSRSFIDNLEARLNRRPMECLKHKTPAEMLEGERRKKQAARRRHFAKIKSKVFDFK